MNNLIYQAFAKQLLNKSLLNFVLVYHIESIAKPRHGGDCTPWARLYQTYINICINFTTEVEHYMRHRLESTAQSSKMRQVVEVCEAMGLIPLLQQCVIN